MLDVGLNQNKLEFCFDLDQDLGLKHICKHIYIDKQWWIIELKVHI